MSEIERASEPQPGVGCSGGYMETPTNETAAHGDALRPVERGAMRRMKVWSGNYDGRNRRMVAAMSQRRAMELLGVSRTDFKNYFGETGNEQDRAIALQEPGVVFERKALAFNEPWRRVGA